jgi:hypothetical protein
MYTLIFTPTQHLVLLAHIARRAHSTSTFDLAPTVVRFAEATSVLRCQQGLKRRTDSQFSENFEE